MIIKEQTPHENLDWTRDWSNELVGDTITVSEWFSDIPLVLTGPVFSNLGPITTTVYISGVRVGTVYTIQNRVKTTGGRTEEAFFQISGVMKLSS